MNKKDCNEHDSCMVQAKIRQVEDGQVGLLTHDEDTNELVPDLCCEGCSHYVTMRDL